MTYSSPLSQPCRTGDHRHCHHTQCACSCHAGEPGVVIPADGSRPGNLRTHQVIDRLNRALEELDLLVAFLVTLAESTGQDPMKMQYPSGEPAMAALVIAQAQTLAALAHLLPAGGGR